MLSLRSNHRPSLFWRTFILLCGLIFFSVVGWLQSFRVLSELPYSQGVAQHIVSTANLTKYALVTADPLFRVDLLKLLAAREGLLLSPRDATDKVVVLSGDGFNGLIEQLVKHQLGQDTILASSVNGVSGLWVSVDIDGDAYWMQTDSGILNPPLGTAWLWWALAACLASLFGATLLTRHVIDPLAKLSQVAAQLGQGKVPDPLPEDAGTAEIQAVNMSFNRMVQDLRRMEADRELLLAGVSHDLRTPITRLRLEVELADLPEDSRTAMVSDLEQMENIVNQFLSYARHSHEEQELVNLGEAVQNAMSNARLASDSTVKITSHIAPNVFIVAHPLELSRAVQNLFTNAMRYGRSEDGILRLHITTGLTDNGKNAMLTVGDEGAGLPEDQRERVMRPFERGESARSGVTGTGLGLAIVDKRREKANCSEVMNIIGNVEGKTCLLLDDMVDTAGSLCGAAKAIVEVGGAKEVFACASHGVLSGPAIDRINDSVIDELLLLDTIPYPKDKPACDKIHYLPVAPVFAEAINRIYEEMSISSLFE